VCCSVLQCVAVCCSVLQCVAVCCSALQCVAVCCSVLQRVAVSCSVLQRFAVCCSVLQCAVSFCSCRCAQLCMCVPARVVKSMCRVVALWCMWGACTVCKAHLSSLSCPQGSLIISQHLLFLTISPLKEEISLQILESPDYTVFLHHQLSDGNFCLLRLLP